jgi:hypothetical protein
MLNHQRLFTEPDLTAEDLLRLLGAFIVLIALAWLCL